MDPTADLALAVELARRAGEQLVELRAGWRGDPARLGAAGDALAQAVLCDALREQRPGDSIFSEEAADEPGRHEAAHVWIIDPLDGTREYAEGRDDWAVHVALWDRVRDGLTVGAVALPGRGIVLASDGTEVAPRPHDGALRIAVSRTRPPAVALAVADALHAELVPMGSAGAKVAAVVLGEVDAYLHAGGMYQWDSAAPVAVARAAGCRSSRLDGSPLRYNELDPMLPDLLVARTEFHAVVMATANSEL